MKTNNSRVFLTFALLHVLLLLPRLLLAILGLRGAPVPLPLQHMADHHPQQAQEEEDGHQDEGDVVWMRPICSVASLSVGAVLGCGDRKDGTGSVPASFTGTGHPSS